MIFKNKLRVDKLISPRSLNKTDEYFITNRLGELTNYHVSSHSLLSFANCQLLIAHYLLPFTKRLAFCLLPLALCFTLKSGIAQNRLTIEQAEKIAIQNNKQYKINAAEIQSAEFSVKAAKEIPKTGVFVENEDYRPSDNIGILKIGLSQSIAWPGLYSARKTYFQEQLKAANLNTELLNTIIKKDVRLAYYQLWYLEDKQRLLTKLDSIYTDLFKASEIRLKAGDTSPLDKISAETKLLELKALINQNGKDQVIQQQQLMMLLNENQWLLPLAEPLPKVERGQSSQLHPLLSLQEQNIQIAQSDIEVQKQGNKPEFSGRFFTQRLWVAKDPFTGFSVSASFPIFNNSAYKNKVNMAKAEKLVQSEILDFKTQQLETQKINALTEIEKSNSLLSFYERNGLKQAEEIIKASTLSYKTGEISFAELSQFLGQAIGIRQNYLDVLNTYNQSVIQFNYLNNN